MMTDLPGAQREPGLVLERRRPGRAGAPSPALIPLLRGKFSPAGEAAAAADFASLRFDEPDELAPARGIAAAVLLSAVAWLPIIGGVWWAVR